MRLDSPAASAACQVGHACCAACHGPSRSSSAQLMCLFGLTFVPWPRRCCSSWAAHTAPLVAHLHSRLLPCLAACPSSLCRPNLERHSGGSAHKRREAPASSTDLDLSHAAKRPNVSPHPASRNSAAPAQAQQAPTSSISPGPSAVHLQLPDATAATSAGTGTGQGASQVQPCASPPTGRLQLAGCEEWQHPAGVNMTASPRGGGGGMQSLARISWGALQGLQSRPIDGEPTLLRHANSLNVL